MSSPAVKVVALIRKKQGITTEQFKEYYEGTYVPLILSITSTISRYIRNYVQENSDWHPASENPTIYDCVTEVWFDTEEGFAKFLKDFTTGETVARVSADEDTFVDKPNGQVFVVKESGGYFKDR